MTCPPKTDPHVKLEWWIEGRQGDEQEAVNHGSKSQRLKVSIAAMTRNLSSAQEFNIATTYPNFWGEI